MFPELVQAAVHPAENDDQTRTETSPEIKYEGVNYPGYIPVLIASVQELKTENEVLIARIEQLEAVISKLTNTQSTRTSATSGALLQNNPNPVRGNTLIKYSLPEGSDRAQLLITDALGRTIKTVQLTESGTVNVDVSALSSGVYNYSLVIKGKTVLTKKMTVGR